jgi:hypothetical protein
MNVSQWLNEREIGDMFLAEYTNHNELIEQGLYKTSFADFIESHIYTYGTIAKDQ